MPKHLLQSRSCFPLTQKRFDKFLREEAIQSSHSVKRPRGEARGKNADERTKRFLDVLFSREISKSRVINKDNTTRIDCASNRLKSSQRKSKKKVHRARGKKILSLSTTKTFFLFPAPLVGWVACPVLKEENFQQFMFLLLPLNILFNEFPRNLNRILRLSRCILQ